MPLQVEQQLARIFPGNSEMARRMREFDWSTTDLGPPEHWPHNLRTALGLCLTSRFPILLWWGPQLTVLYNDAYISFLGNAKHPRFLGRPGHECWSEIWSTIGPMLQGVMRTGEATWSEDVRYFFSRHLPREEVYVRFTYGPILSDDGQQVDGVFTPCTETTDQVIGARRLDTLGRLGMKDSRGRSVEGACMQAMEALAANPHDVPFAAVYLLEGDRARLAACTSGTVPACTPALVRLAGGDSAQASPWPWSQVLSSHKAMEVTDLPARGVELPGSPHGEPPRHALMLPLAASHGGLAGVLIAGTSPRRPLDGGHRTFLELVARHIGTAIADARTFEQERARAEALAQLDRVKTEFFSNVSHEFRTPLTLMLGPLEEAMERSPEPLRELLGVAQRNGERLRKLVNTLLDFARIEAGRIHARYQQTDVGELTADLASAFRSACERAGLELRVQIPAAPVVAWVDRDMWEKVVLNLLSNAFKYTLVGEIVVSVSEEEGGTWRLSVADSGVGIPPQSLAQVFQRFHRLHDGRGRSHEGSGIGLALVQEVVKLHGGTIAVESELDRGSTFTVQMPLGHAHLPATQVQRTPDADGRSAHSTAYVQEALGWIGHSTVRPSRRVSPAARSRARVLLADDNSDLRDYLQRLLASDYEVLPARNGAEALALARRFTPDLVVTDVMMPTLDGNALVHALRGDEALHGVPILMLSARAGEEARIEGLQSGADDYLVKPFSARELKARVATLLAGAATRGQAYAELQEHSTQISALLDHAPLGVVLVNADLRIQQVNPMALPVFGDIGPLPGRDFSEVMHLLWEDDFADDVVGIFRHTLATGDSYASAESAERRRDRGVMEYYEWRVDRIPMPDGRPGLVCYFRDISRQVLERKELERSHTALHAANERKGAFIATLSHELRTPLAPLRNGLEILRRVEDRATLERVHGMMERQLVHMVRLIDDLLDMSRITKGKIELQRSRVDLGKALQQAIEASRPFIELAGHALRIDVPPAPVMVDGDLTRLAQVFINLLNNAAKFTPTGGTISVRMEQLGGRALVHIQDTGIGVEAELQQTMFDMFAQEQGGQGGLGIGLALSRGLMQMHGGDITLRSGGRGQGSVFTVTLPVANEQKIEHGITHGEPVSSHEASGLHSPPRSLSVLVADDNRDSARSLALILRMQGHRASLAFDGEDALALAESLRPDVLLLDIDMPKRDGYEVARAVRTSDWGQRATLIALTGWGQPEDRKRAEEVGFDHHLLKPVDTLIVEQLLRDAQPSQWPPLDEATPPATAEPHAARNGSSFTS